MLQNFAQKARRFQQVFTLPATEVTAPCVTRQMSFDVPEGIEEARQVLA